MIANTNMIVQKLGDSIISQARILGYSTHLIISKQNDVITPISILRQTSSGLLNALPSLPTNPPTFIS
jgi:hypothetical protein